VNAFIRLTDATKWCQAGNRKGNRKWKSKRKELVDKDEKLSYYNLRRVNIDRKKGRMKQFTTSKKQENKGSEPAKKAKRTKRSFHPTGSTVNHILHLQKTVGNHAVQRMIESGSLQLKSNRIQPGDVYSQEVDRLAQQFEGEIQNRNEGTADGAQEQKKEQKSIQGRGGLQRKLKLGGEKTHINSVLDILNAGLFNYKVTINSKGYLKLEKKNTKGTPTPAQKALYQRLYNIIEKDPKKVIILVKSGLKVVLVGNAVYQVLDIKDIKAFGKGEGISSLSALVHELEEQYQYQVKIRKGRSKRSKMKAQQEAHEKGGIVAEEEISGATRGEKKVLSGRVIGGGLSVDGIIEIPYTYPDGKIVIVKMTIEKGNIIKVERRVKKGTVKKK
jgi:hypothetical protein